MPDTPTEPPTPESTPVTSPDEPSMIELWAKDPRVRIGAGIVAVVIIIVLLIVLL